MEAIKQFLSTFPDDRLAALLDHARAGKLSFESCCCLIGSLNAPHPLQEGFVVGEAHLEAAREFPFAIAAEDEFKQLGSDNDERRAKVIPLIEAEINSRVREAVHA